MPDADDPDIRYLCQRCANCCRWPGEVVLEEADVHAIAEFLRLTPHEFTARHTRLRRNRAGLTLMEKSNGECVFLDDIDCTINDVKPTQCRDFPNKWRFPGWRQVCEAIPVDPEEGNAPRAGSEAAGEGEGRSLPNLPAC